MTGDIMRGSHRINSYFRNRLIKRWRNSYTGPTPSLFCNNCTGAMMLHDLGLEFRSPFVNLWIEPDDFIALCERPLELLRDGVLEPYDSPYPYPAGQIEGHPIYFQHYDSFDQAATIWHRRITRVDWYDFWVLLVNRDTTSPELARRFNALPNEHKLVLEPLGSSAVSDVLSLPRATKRDGSLEIVTDYSGLLGARYYDEFDFSHWFTTGLARRAT